MDDLMCPVHAVLYDRAAAWLHRWARAGDRYAWRVAMYLHLPSPDMSAIIIPRARQAAAWAFRAQLRSTEASGRLHGILAGSRTCEQCLRLRKEVNPQ